MSREQEDTSRNIISKYCRTYVQDFKSHSASSKPEGFSLESGKCFKVLQELQKRMLHHTRQSDIHFKLMYNSAESAKEK